MFAAQSLDGQAGAALDLKTLGKAQSEGLAKLKAELAKKPAGQVISASGAVSSRRARRLRGISAMVWVASSNRTVFSARSR